MKGLGPNRATDPAAMRAPSARPETAALLARVEALSGGDRETDAEICAALEYVPDAEFFDLAVGYARVYRVEHNWGGDPVVGIRSSKDGDVSLTGCTRRPQHVTASLDSALALVERVRPGWWGNIEWGDRARATVFELHVRSFSGEGATPALALLAALLRSLSDTASSPEPDATRQDGRGEG